MHETTHCTVLTMPCSVGSVGAHWSHRQRRHRALCRGPRGRLLRLPEGRNLHHAPHVPRLDDRRDEREVTVALLGAAPPLLDGGRAAAAVLPAARLGRGHLRRALGRWVPILPRPHEPEERPELVLHTGDAEEARRGAAIAAQLVLELVLVPVFAGDLEVPVQAGDGQLVLQLHRGGSCVYKNTHFCTFVATCVFQV